MGKSIAALALAAALLLTGCSATSSTAPPAPAPVREEPDIPSGFTDWGNGVAYKFVDRDSDEFDCSYYDRCSMVRVYAYSACLSGVYIEANILDEADTVVDYTNDTLASLDQGQQGLLTLGILGDAGSQVRIVKISCH